MQKTKQQIITELYESGWLKQTVKNICGENQRYSDDLLQEVTLILLEYKNDNMITVLYEMERLNYFIAKIIKIQLNGSQSEFYRKYRKNELNTISLDETLNQATLRDTDEF